MELNFLIQPEEFEKNGIVPISLDLEKTLDDLVRLESMIRQHVPDFRLESIPDDDAKTFTMLSKGETEGIPLLNDKWIRKCLSIMEPSNLDELDALMSLYHNGPPDLLPMYMDAKRGMLPHEYLALQEIEALKRTHEVIVYKEQIVDVLTQVAGFSESDALCFFRALSRGGRDVIDRYKEKFKNNMARVHRDSQYAERLIDMIRMFSYKSYKRKVGFWHTVITYRLAFIKCHYPDAFGQVMATKPKEEL